MSKQEKNVADEQMRMAFDECAGRAAPPNRLDEILKLASDAAGAPAGGRQANQLRTGKLWAAALLLLGLGTTITASVLKNHADDAAAKQPVLTTSVGEQQATIAIDAAPVAAMTNANVQDPKPTPKSATKQVAKPTDKAAKKVLPKGADPADLAAIRSAEAMLEAEKNLRKLMTEGKIVGVDQVLPFDELSGWKYTDALEGMPKNVKMLDGKKVLMLGFMLPIDEVQDIKEFLLVESLWSCCYGEPPDINGIVRCVMPKGKTLDYQFDPMKLVGTLQVEATTMDGYCVDIYQMHVDYVEVIEAAAPTSVEPTKEELKKLEDAKGKRKAKRKNGKDC